MLPQASVEEKVRVCERLHPLTTTASVITSTVTAPQASVAVAEPKAASIADSEGLQPKSAPLATEPEALMVGAVTS